jgi:hypothetical protein
MVDFTSAKLTTADCDIIAAIVNRAVELKCVKPDQRLEANMDISAAHMSNPLRLTDLLAADKFNFAHDVLGITQNLNRESGKLERFCPRFSK